MGPKCDSKLRPWFIYTVYVHFPTQKHDFYAWRVVLYFVCFVPFENFSLIWRRHNLRWRAANFDLNSALLAIEQWGFFRVPHLLWHGPTLYNGRLRVPVSLIPYTEHLAVGFHYRFFFLQIRCDAAGNLTLSLLHAGRPTAPPPPLGLVFTILTNGTKHGIQIFFVTHILKRQYQGWFLLRLRLNRQLLLVLYLGIV